MDHIVVISRDWDKLHPPYLARWNKETRFTLELAWEVAKHYTSQDYCAARIFEVKEVGGTRSDLPRPNMEPTQ